MQKFLVSNLIALKAQLKIIIVFFLTYVIGIIIGALFIKSDYTTIIFANTINYHVIITNTSISLFQCFFNCFFVGLLLTLVVICLGFSKISIPFICIILFYRGLVLGGCAVNVFSLMQFSGLIIFIILTLPTHLIITTGLIFASVLNYQSNNCNNKCIAILKNAIVCIVFVLLASIYFLLVTALIIRPINALF